MSSCIACLVRQLKLAFGLPIFLSLNQARKLTIRASNAAALAAGFASGRAGLNWAVPEWCIRMFCAPRMSILKSSPALRLDSGSIAPAPEFMNSTIFVCCSRTILDFLSSLNRTSFDLWSLYFACLLKDSSNPRRTRLLRIQIKVQSTKLKDHVY